MKDDAERARECLASTPHSKGCNFLSRALADCDCDRPIRAMLAFAQQPEGWSKVAALEEAASECSRIGVGTIFASDLTDDFKAGYQAAVNTCCASLALIARHAIPAAMLDVTPIPDERP